MSAAESGGALASHAPDDKRRAVIDIGSNTVRLVIYGGPPRAPAVLWNEKVSARLGRDLAKTGAIPPAAMAEALAALARYAAILRDHGIGQIEAVATAAPRDATNGGEFIARVGALGLDVRLLSGEEEARASACGVIGAFPDATGVVADLGGGSLELVAVAHGACRDGTSLPLGTLRLPELKARGRFDSDVGTILESAHWARAHPGPLYLVGGTWRAFAAYAMRRMDHPLTDPHAFALDVEQADMLAMTLQESKPAKLAQLRGISSMRAEKLPDAAALLRVLLATLKPAGLLFSSWGLREGLHFRRLEPAVRDTDPLLAGVAAFAGERPARTVDAPLLAAWTKAAARDRGAEAERLRLAAAHLAPALQAVEPNLRPAHALEWALDKRWIGIDARGRARLAAALLGSLASTTTPDRLARLASADDLGEATGWGLALRLAQRLGAGSRAVLASSRLTASEQHIELAIDSDHAALAGAPVTKDMAALAQHLKLEPSIHAAA